jgi:integrase
MVMLELRGVHRVTVKGRVYWYAWRGGPRVRGEPGTPEFMESYQEALDSRTVVTGDRFRAAIADYKASDAYKALAPSTRKQWARWLDRIADHFGDLRTVQFGRTDKIRPIIRKWRAQYDATPRTADYAMQVLSRVLSHCVDPLGLIGSNPCEGIKNLYKNDRSEIIWTDADLAQIKSVCSEELAFAFDLGALTGLRLSDLVRLSWSHIGENEIIIATGKGRRKKTRAIIPLYGELRELLERIPKRATTILTNTRKRPWTTNGIGTSIQDAKEAAGLRGRDLHFHDLRGTAATKFYLSGLSMRVISEILAWDEAAVEAIIRRYVGRQSATLEAIRQIDQTRRRT